MGEEPTVRSRVILIENGQLALIKRVRDGRTYYIFPGGAVEENETPEQAAVREAHEELGLHIRLGRHVATQEYAGHEHRFYLATATSGEFGKGCGSEYSEDRGPGDTEYLPMWISIGELAVYDVRPPRLAEALLSGEIEGWDGRQIEER